ASISENGLDTAIQNILGNIVRASIHTDEELTDEEIANKISVTPHPLAGRVQLDDGFSLSPLWWTVIGAVAALALGGVVTWIVVRRRRLLEEEEFEEELTPQPVTPEVPSLHDVPENEETVMRRQLQGLARRKPEEFANLLRTWLSEE
ncbi:MAG: flagellar M-ring protein FliF, partial [Novibacillus thermophilus]